MTVPPTGCHGDPWTCTIQHDCSFLNVCTTQLYCVNVSEERLNGCACCSKWELVFRICKFLKQLLLCVAGLGLNGLFVSLTQGRTNFIKWVLGTSYYDHGV